MAFDRYNLRLFKHWLLNHDNWVSIASIKHQWGRLKAIRREPLFAIVVGIVTCNIQKFFRQRSLSRTIISQIPTKCYNFWELRRFHLTNCGELQSKSRFLPLQEWTHSILSITKLQSKSRSSERRKHWSLHKTMSGTRRKFTTTILHPGSRSY